MCCRLLVETTTAMHSRCGYHEGRRVAFRGTVHWERLLHDFCGNLDSFCVVTPRTQQIDRLRDVVFFCCLEDTGVYLLGVFLR